jgi:hypothetical protein
VGRLDGKLQRGDGGGLGRDNTLCAFIGVFLFGFSWLKKLMSNKALKPSKNKS